MRASSSKSSNVASTGRRPTNSGISPNLSKSLRLDLAEQFAGLAVFGRIYLRAETDRCAAGHGRI